MDDWDVDFALDGVYSGVTAGQFVVLTRGSLMCVEQVKNEILGSGDASIPFQSFRLKKSPLTYLADPTAPNGRRSTLEVHVNGQKWRQAQSFYGALPTDQIYVVRHDEDHQTHVVFGDGELGLRVPTGSNNVVATYRFGVGGNVPANSITALKKPVKGIRKVLNPLPATGGKEPPAPEQVRREAPLGLLVLGRLVSLPDFEAETRRYGNVVNAKARWGRDEAGEDAAIQVWFATRQGARYGDRDHRLREGDRDRLVVGDRRDRRAGLDRRSGRHTVVGQVDDVGMAVVDQLLPGDRIVRVEVVVE